MWVSVPAGGRGVSVCVVEWGRAGREEKNKEYMRRRVGARRGCGEGGSVESSDSR